jgi:creatinine amidohydrolase
MNNRPWILAETTLKMYRHAPMEVAVLPIGATEPHNLHLPCGTDTFEVSDIGEKACEIAWKRGGRAVALPAIPFGTNSNFAGFPGFIHLNPTTHLAILRDVVWSLESYGVRKLVILNGHGGNNFQPFLRELWPTTKLFISVINWWQILPELFEKLFVNPGEHGDEMETSLMLHLCPHLVSLKDADAGSVRKPRLKTLREGWVIFTRPWKRLTTNTGYGNPRLATAEKGRKILDAITRKIGAYLVELAKAKVDAKFPY